MASCAVLGHFKQLTPAESKEPAVLFDQYILEMYGKADSADSQYSFLCDVEFVEKVPKSTPRDSIPVFLIDSFCFEGACLEQSYCDVPIGFHEYELRMSKIRGYPSITSPVDTDLTWSHKYYLPLGFLVWDRIELPMKCEDKGVAVMIHARLLDRLSGDELARESLRVPFEIKWEEYRQSFMR
jgi:hypothetical protein